MTADRSKTTNIVLIYFIQVGLGKIGNLKAIPSTLEAGDFREYKISIDTEVYSYLFTFSLLDIFLQYRVKFIS